MTNTTNNSSNFGINLPLYFFLAAILKGTTYAGLAMEEGPATPIFYALLPVYHWASWSFYIGLIYGFFRLFNVRSDVLEWYYQNIPFGFYSIAPKLETTFSSNDFQSGATSAQSSIPGNHSSSEQTTEIDWNKFLSVDYIRYAGLILIISAIFALLFRIEWGLTQKIIASFIGAGIAIACAELGQRHQKNVLAGSCFLIAFALTQFALTLLFKFYHNKEILNSFDAWLIIKTVFTGLGIFGLFRFRASFVPVVFFLIAYATPLSMLRVIADIPLYSGLGFILIMSIMSLAYGVLKNHFEVALVNIFCANLLAIEQVPAANFFNQLFSSLAKHPVSVLTSGDTLSQGNLAVFICIAVVLALHVIAATIYALRLVKPDSTQQFMRRPQDWTLSICEIIIGQFFFLITLTSLQSIIPSMQGYYGFTLLVASLILLCSYLSLLAKGLSNAYTEVVLNSALVISAIGMFIETKGAWSAIVFLLFSCLAIYISFILGTLRTRVYAFLALTVSLFKLYLECSELFNSISGSTVILAIGVLLLVLSYKLEKIKSLIK